MSDRTEIKGRMRDVKLLKGEECVMGVLGKGFDGCVYVWVGGWVVVMVWGVETVDCVKPMNKSVVSNSI